MGSMFQEEVPQGTDRDILISLFTSFRGFTQTQDRTNIALSERLLELLHKQEQKADKADVNSLKHEIALKADKADIERLMVEDRNIEKRLIELERRNIVVDGEIRGKQRAFNQIKELGAGAWGFIFGITSFFIMIISFIKN